MTAKKEASEQVANLARALVEDVEQATDAELMQELQEDGLNADNISDSVAKGIAGAVARHGKRELAKAQRGVRDDKPQRLSTSSQILSLDQKRALLARFAATDSGLNAKLTMAARSGQAPTESDLDSILQDLRDLGVIDEGKGS